MKNFFQLILPMLLLLQSFSAHASDRGQALIEILTSPLPEVAQENKSYLTYGSFERDAFSEALTQEYEFAIANSPQVKALAELGHKYLIDYLQLLENDFSKTDLQLITQQEREILRRLIEWRKALRPRIEERRMTDIEARNMAWRMALAESGFPPSSSYTMLSLKGADGRPLYPVLLHNYNKFFWEFADQTTTAPTPNKTPEVQEFKQLMTYSIASARNTNFQSAARLADPNSQWQIKVGKEITNLAAEDLKHADIRFDLEPVVEKNRALINRVDGRSFREKLGDLGQWLRNGEWKREARWKEKLSAWFFKSPTYSPSQPFYRVRLCLNDGRTFYLTESDYSEMLNDLRTVPDNPFAGDITTRSYLVQASHRDQMLADLNMSIVQPFDLNLDMLQARLVTYQKPSEVLKSSVENVLSYMPAEKMPSDVPAQLYFSGFMIDPEYWPLRVKLLKEITSKQHNELLTALNSNGRYLPRDKAQQLKTFVEKTLYDWFYQKIGAQLRQGQAEGVVVNGQANGDAGSGKIVVVARRQLPLNWKGALLGAAALVAADHFTGSHLMNLIQSMLPPPPQWAQGNPNSQSVLGDGAKQHRDSMGGGQAGRSQHSDSAGADGSNGGQGHGHLPRFDSKSPHSMSKSPSSGDPQEPSNATDSANPNGKPAPPQPAFQVKIVGPYKQPIHYLNLAANYNLPREVLRTSEWSSEPRSVEKIELGNMKANVVVASLNLSTTSNGRFGVAQLPGYELTNIQIENDSDEMLEPQDFAVYRIPNTGLTYVKVHGQSMSAQYRYVAYYRQQLLVPDKQTISFDRNAITATAKKLKDSGAAPMADALETVALTREKISLEDLTTVIGLNAVASKSPTHEPTSPYANPYWSMSRFLNDGYYNYDSRGADELGEAFFGDYFRLARSDWQVQSVDGYAFNVRGESTVVTDQDVHMHNILVRGNMAYSAIEADLSPRLAKQPVRHEKTPLVSQEPTPKTAERPEMAKAALTTETDRLEHPEGFEVPLSKEEETAVEKEAEKTEKAEEKTEQKPPTLFQRIANAFKPAPPPPKKIFIKKKLKRPIINVEHLEKLRKTALTELGKLEKSHPIFKRLNPSYLNGIEVIAYTRLLIDWTKDQMTERQALEQFVRIEQRRDDQARNAQLAEERTKADSGEETHVMGRILLASREAYSKVRTSMTTEQQFNPDKKNPYSFLNDPQLVDALENIYHYINSLSWFEPPVYTLVEVTACEADLNP